MHVAASEPHRIAIREVARPRHSALCRHLGEDGLVIGPIIVKISEHELERLDRVSETDRYELIGVGIGQRPE